MRVVLDTDIGSDVDDALALGVLLGSSTVDDLAVTTVYGDTLLRARLAGRLAELAGRRLTVVAGEPETMSGKPVWWAGHEGAGYDDLESVPVARSTAVDFLVNTVAARPGEVDVVAVGPLTNIARAIVASTDFAAQVRHLYVMGGRFDGAGKPEHNVASDIDAARAVFSSAIPCTVTGLDVTTRVRIHAAEVDRIAAAGEFGAALKRQIRTWWQFTGEAGNVPHDPLAVLTLLEPDAFEYATGTIHIGPDGTSTLRAGDGPARVATAVDAPRAVEAMVSRIVAAG